MLARTLAVAVCVLALVGCGGDAGDEDAVTEAPAWDHDPNDTTSGPAVWSEIDDSFEECGTGDRQSPVDIADAVPAELSELELDYPQTSLVVENTGHVIEVSVPPSSELTLTIGDAEYRLVQFHFHAPSEHTLDGEPYDAEAHLVHEAEDGELAVVGVFLEEGEPALPLVDAVLDSAPENAGDEVEIEGEASPLELLGVLDASSATAASYFTYPGSLTTPGCSEGVRWILMQDVTPVSSAAIDRLHALIGGFPGYDGYENNNRPTQPLNERVVQRSATAASARRAPRRTRSRAPRPRPVRSRAGRRGGSGAPSPARRRL